MKTSNANDARKYSLRYRLTKSLLTKAGIILIFIGIFSFFSLISMVDNKQISNELAFFLLLSLGIAPIILIFHGGSIVKLPKFFCPFCGKYIEENRSWKCPYCDQDNWNKSFFYECKYCGQKPNLIRCPYCKQDITILSQNDGKVMIINEKFSKLVGSAIEDLFKNKNSGNN